MKSKKGTMFDPVFMVGIVVLGLMMAVIVSTRNVGIPTPQSTEDVDRATALVRSKYIINSLETVEFGEVTEKLLKPATFQAGSDSSGRFLKVGECKENSRECRAEIKADIAAGSVNSAKIKFVKKKGSPITMQEG